MRRWASAVEEEMRSKTPRMGRKLDQMNESMVGTVSKFVKAVIRPHPVIDTGVTVVLGIRKLKY